MTEPSIHDDEFYVLPFGSAANSLVRAFLTNAVRPHLLDVRAMLHLPRPEVAITAGCNFASVQVLLNVLSGLSRLMGPGPSNSGEHFKQFVRRRYPWKLEPEGGYRRIRGTDALYDRLRNGYAHDLGLSMESVRT